MCQSATILLKLYCNTKEEDDSWRNISPNGHLRYCSKKINLKKSPERKKALRFTNINVFKTQFITRERNINAEAKEFIVPAGWETPLWWLSEQLECLLKRSRVSDVASAYPVEDNIRVAAEDLDLGSALWEGSQCDQWNSEPEIPD